MQHLQSTQSVQKPGGTFEKVSNSAGTSRMSLQLL